MSENNLNDIPPFDFDDEQKKEYDYLLRQSRLMFPDAPDFVLKIGVGAYIRQGVNKEKYGTKEDIQKLKQEYLSHKFDPEELAMKPLEKSLSNIDNNNEVLQANA
jgi:hypothetical protein